MTASLLRLQQEFLEFLETEIVDLKAKEADSNISEDFITVLDDDVIQNYNDARERHRELVAKYQSKKSAEATKYIDENIFGAIRSAYLEIRTILTSKKPKSAASRSSDILNTTVVAPPTQHFELRLPEVPIPSFDGNYNEWLSFDSIFTATVHASTTLEDIQKLQMLRSSLKGEALNVIKNLEFTSKNYVKARGLLMDRYHHPRRLVNSYLRRLYEYPAIKTESSSTLKTFLDNINDCEVSLTSLGSTCNDSHFVYHMVKKLPVNTATAWEEKLGSSIELPQLTQFKEFIERRYRVLEMTEIPEKENKASTAKTETKTLVTKNHDSTKPKPSKGKNKDGKQPRMKPCVLCSNKNHLLFSCFRFQALSVQDKWNVVRKHNQCSNCLGNNHTPDQCKSPFTCKICQEKHHTMLHIFDRTQANSNLVAMQPPPFVHGTHLTLDDSQPSSKSFHSSGSGENLKLLGTAEVKAINHVNGSQFTIRALIDPCSELSYIVDSLVQELQLEKERYGSKIIAFGGVSAGEVDHVVDFRIKSIHSNFELPIKAAVANVITGDMPSSSIANELCQLPSHLPLADPRFNVSGPIHILLGVGPTAQIKERGIFRISPTLIAQKTKLGYVVEGELDHFQNNSQSSTYMTQSMAKKLHDQIERFWRIEEHSEPTPSSPEDLLCEQIFLSSVNRRCDGRLAVDLPFRLNKEPSLGSSKSIAIQRFLNLEKKLNLYHNHHLKSEYFKTIQDYINSGHLIKCENSLTNNEGYFIPHHAVIKEASSSTKVRVVYDASCKTTNGTSLNSHLLTGPRLQNDIRDVLSNWRKYPIAFTSDIEKMYRMFWVNEAHRKYQKIIWRFSSSEPLQEYTLATITFGTSSAPYQAIRCLHYLADTYIKRYPLAAKTIKNEFYVDDCISGAYDLDEARQKQSELRAMLSSYGLTLRKWCSNNLLALEGIPKDQIENLIEFNFDETDFKKTLGIFWSPAADCFSFSSNIPEPSGERFTKREVLSSISLLYDPLGWVSPCTMRAKIFMQNLWKSKASWDEQISEQSNLEFCNFIYDLKKLNEIRIPRWIKIPNSTVSLSIIGFSDASEKGYGAVIYLLDPQASDPSKKLILLSSRTKCCDLKYTSIARWELNGALLLANLFEWAFKVFEGHLINKLAFSDSKIVLSWLRADPSRWKPYVANRTQKIIKRVDASRWHYIESKLNPADYASRGMLPSEIINAKLWWEGPTLEKHIATQTELTLDEKQTEIVNEEVKKTSQVFLQTTQDIYAYINKSSDHHRLIGEITVHIRFVRNCLNRIVTKSRDSQKTSRLNDILKRLEHPELVVFRLLQTAYYSVELDALRKGRLVSGDSKIKTLNPFIDTFEIMRVGGRLQNADLPYSQRHPIILPMKSQVTTNIIKQAHLATHHSGNQLTEHYIRCYYYIPRLQDRVRHFIHNCVVCRKFARYQHQQLMGSLPFDRVNSSRAFQHSGVDYAGPIQIKAYKGRCKIIHKAYIAVFVCLYSKAIHTEIVTDLTSVGFLAAFKRFVSRRGRCHKLFSDNGTNFKGANKIMQAEIKKAEASWKGELEANLSVQGTEWHFIPPSSPHFGGLWEASVKSIKTHLVKTIGATLLTYEELNTLVIQIEGILNSRPLCPKSNHPEEFVALTPAHLLIGEPIVAPIEPFYEPEKTPTKRWTHIQSLRQKFDISWKRDHSHRLQQRPKWLNPGIQFKEGALVWVTDDRMPPTQYSLAKILHTHPGADGIVRAVTIIYPNKKTTRRSVAKLRLLPSVEISENF